MKTIISHNIRITALTLLSLLCLAQIISPPVSNAQLEQYKGDPIYRYQGIHSGNKVRTIFYNYGLVGNIGEISGEWPLGTGNEYVGDVTITVGLEFNHTMFDSIYVPQHDRWYIPANDTVVTVITCKSPRGTDDLNQAGVHQGFEPLPGFGSPPLQGSDEPGQVAMSHRPETWPAFWPDKMYSDDRDVLWEVDNNDPGWRGQWNGYFGKDVTNADQESYFQMDDNMDREFRWRNLIDATADTVVEVGSGNDIRPFRIPWYPTEDDTTRGGYGIRVASRGFQWSHFLAEDAIIWQYEIANVSDHNYDKAVFGMVVGTLAGGRQDTQDDLAFFDPENDITYSYDENNGPSNTPGWVPVADDHEVGWIGYAFLESPGNEFDGIDNDGDYANPDSPTLTADQLRTWVIEGIYINPGDELVLIDYNTYEREVVTMPATGILEWDFRGDTRILRSDSLLKEDGYNGFDDNFNGLIDERYVQPGEGIDARLDHVGFAYKDYFSGAGVDDLLIDEARDDGIDNDGDWDPNTDDLGFDGQPGTGDQGEGDGQPTQGEPNFDKTDINESDQIGLTSFDYFNIQEADALVLRSDIDVWRRLQPGFIDVVPQQPMDGDFIYGSGYFPLPSGNTQRFSTALFFGEDSTDVFLNKQTVQQIYDSNYNFARPPEKPTVQAVEGDGFVTLYWDDVAEFSIDNSQPTGDEMDFEGYKIYRATDPGFLENFIITDGLGRKVFHKPIAQFDLQDGKAGFFPSGNIGVSFYLGEDTGLQHVWTDSTVENGQTYYYAVAAYDFGNDSTGVFPAETSKFIFVDESGNTVTDRNTVVVVPGQRAAGYVPPVEGGAEPIAGTADAFVNIEVVDPTIVPDNTTYHVNFSDADSLLRAQRYSIFRVEDGDSTAVIDSRSLANRYESRRIYELYEGALDTIYATPGSEYDVRSYFQVVETPVFDGMRAFMLVPRRPATNIAAQSGWEPATSVDPDSMLSVDVGIINRTPPGWSGDSLAADYKIEFFNEPVDTSLSADFGFGARFNSIPIYFNVTNLSTGREPLILFADGVGEADGRINDRSEILLLEVFDRDGDDQPDTVATWSIGFYNYPDFGEIYDPVAGDELYVRQYEPFSSRDLFEFNSESAMIDEDMIDLSRIKVYPNPYLGANVQEPSNPYSSGRGERRITFIHLPAKCTIRIYTVRGELVDIIEHNESIYDGTANWDLRNKDGLDIAYGVYVYHVESDHGEHIGKFAVVK